MTTTSVDVDEYLARIPIPYRQTLSVLRETIAKAAPAAAECVSYRMPAFRYRGRVRTNHC